MTGSQTPRETSKIQRWMQAVITHPQGVVAGIESEQAQSEIDVAPGDIEDVISRSNALDSIQRLHVYANAYYARLLECLRDEFPALVHTLGEEAFDGFAFGYLQTYPSQSYTLADLSRKFPRYLAETRPAESDPAGGDADWPEFLIDLATLERTYSEVFDGPGTEGEQILKSEDLTAISPGIWPAARLVPVPCLRLLRLSYPAHEYVSGIRRKENPPPPEPSPTYLVITRREYVVRRTTVSRDEYDLLQLLIDGQTVGEAIRQTAEHTETEFDEFADSLQTWFRNWAVGGFFLSVELPE